MHEPVDTWVKRDDFCKEFPNYKLADKLFQKEGGNVMDSFVGIHYKHRKPTNQSKTSIIES